MNFVSPRKRKREKSPTLGEKSKIFYGEMFLKDGNKIYKCNECERDNGNKEYNLACHLENCHRELHNQIHKKKKDHLAVKRLKLLQNAVEIVSKNGLPFNFLLSSGYQNGIQNKVRKLNQAGYSINLSNSNLTDMKQHVMAQKARQEIREKVRNKHLSVLLDIATNNRSILGVSVQLRLKGKFTLYSFGIVELHAAHTATYLAKVCIGRLNFDEVNMRKVVSVTRDNGANVSKMVRDMHIDLQNSVSQQAKSNSPSGPTKYNVQKSFGAGKPRTTSHQQNVGLVDYIRANPFSTAARAAALNNVPNRTALRRIHEADIGN